MEWKDEPLALTCFSTPAIEMKSGGSVREARVSREEPTAGSWLVIWLYFDHDPRYDWVLDARGEPIAGLNEPLPISPPGGPLRHSEGGRTFWIPVDRGWLEHRRDDGIDLTLGGEGCGNDVVAIPAWYVEGFLLALDRRIGR